MTATKAIVTKRLTVASDTHMWHKLEVVGQIVVQPYWACQCVLAEGVGSLIVYTTCIFIVQVVIMKDK